MDVECIVEAGNLVGECPLWHPGENSVYWMDINGFAVQRYSLDKRKTKIWHFREVVCALSLTTDPEWMLVALGSRLILWAPATDKRIDYCHPGLASEPFERRGERRQWVLLDWQHAQQCGSRWRAPGSFRRYCGRAWESGTGWCGYNAIRRVGSSHATPWGVP